MAEGKKHVLPPFEAASSSWNDVTRHMAAVSSTKSESKGSVHSGKLTVVCFAHRWSPEAQSTVEALLSLQSQGKLDSAAAFVVDADRDREACGTFGIAVTPALVLHWDGTPMLIRRQGWNDDSKFCGCLSEANLHRLCRRAQQRGEKGERDLNCEF